MKQIYSYLLIAFITFSANNLFSQGTNCATAEPFCTSPGVPYSYNNVTGFPDVTDVGCLLSVPNQSWFYIKTSAAGAMTYSLTQSSVSPGGTPDLDVDFIAYGPYTAAQFPTACSLLTGTCTADHACTGNVEDCSYSIASTETMTLTPTAAGQYFIIMITNYEDSPGYITFTQTGGAGSDCAITCPADNFTLEGTNNTTSLLVASGSTLNCSQNITLDPPNLGGLSYNPFTDQLTPCLQVHIDPFTNNIGNNGSIHVFEGGINYWRACPSASCTADVGGTSATNGLPFGWYLGQVDPNFSHPTVFCRTTPISGTTPTVTLRSCWDNTAILAGPQTWSSTACFTLTAPASPTAYGAASFSIAPTTGSVGLTDTNWGQAALTPSLIPSGTYTVTYSFNNNVCGVLHGYYVFTIPATPTISAASAVSQTVCSGSAVAAENFSLTPAGSFNWTNSNTAIGVAASGSANIASYTAPNVTTTTIGNFTVTPTSSGCIGSPVTFTITIDPKPVASITSAPTNSLCLNGSVTFTAATASTFTWSGSAGNGLSGSSGSPITATPTSTGNITYTVNMTSASGCTNTISKTMTVNPIPTANAGTTRTLTCLATNTTLTGSGGGTYSWSGPGITGGGSTATPTINLPGTYSLTVTSAAGCPSTLTTVSVTQNTTAPAVAGATSGTLTCTTLTVNASSTTSTTPVSYNWSGTGITAGTGTGTITVNQPGTFNYTVTNTSNGCSTTGSQVVAQNITAPAVAAATTGTLTCTALTINASATTSTTPVSYNWSGTGITAGTGTGTITVNQPGTFNYTVTNTSNGCKTTGSQAVAQNTAAPAVAAATTGTLTCTALTVNASATTSTTPVSYVWSGTGITAGAGTGTITVNQPGTFNYTVTNTSNGCSTTGSQAVAQNTAAPAVAAATTGTLTCTALTVNASATTSTTPVSYVWSGTGITAGASTGTITVNQPGTFNYTVTNTSNGCSTTGSQAVAQNTTVPTVTVSGTQTITCVAPTVTLTGSATPSTCTPVWTGGVSSGSNSYTATASSGNTYTLTVTNPANGCFNSATTQVVPSAGIPSVTTSVTNSLSCTTLTAQVVATTTASPVTYSWTGSGITGGATTASATVNTGGQYTVVVTNTVSACSSTLTISVVQNTTVPTVTGATSGSLNCTTTTVNVSATTSVTPVSYNWSGPGITAGSGTGTITVNQGGTYNYTVTNTANTCSTTGSQAITQSTTAPSVAGANTGSLNCTVLSVNASATTSTTPVSYNWSGPGITAGSGTGTITVNLGGTYNYTVTNTANTCSTTGSQTITQNTTGPSVAGTNTGSLNCTVLSVNANATTSTTPVSYNWSGPGITAGSGTGTITVNQGGTYNYTVTNTVNSCSTTGSQAITQSTTAPSVAGANTGSLNCTVLSVNASATTSTTPASYNWSGLGITAGSGTGTITVNQGGTYNYTVTNTANTCSTTGSQAITQSTTAPSVAGANTGSLNCTVLSVNASATTSTTPVSYNWSGPGITAGSGTGTITVNQGGTYNYTVTNTANTCSVTGSQAITQNTTGPSVAGANTGSLNCTVLSVNANATTSTTPVSYNWTGPGITAGAGTGTITVNQGGTYNYTVTNTANACLTTGSQAIIQSTTAPSVTGANTGSLNCTVLNVNASATTSTTPVSYNWSGSGITAGSGTGTITVNQGGTYNYTVTNTANTCSTTGSQAITQNTTAPTTTASTTGSITCVTNTISLNSTLAGMNYTWTAPGGSSVISGASLQNAVGQGLGTYSLTVLNTANSCTFQTSVAAIQNITTPTSVDAGPNQALVCVTPTVPLLGSATPSTATANWLGGVATPNTFTTNTGAAGVYTLQAIEPTTGCYITSTVAVTQSTDNPVVNANPVTNSITCTNSVVAVGITVTSTASVNYAWPTGTGISGPTNGATTTATLSGVYQVTVTNQGNGCISVNPISVPQNTTPVIVGTTPASSITCFNPTETLNITPVGANYTYTWTGSGITSGGSTTNPVVNTGGDYSVTVTNTVNGCTGTGAINVPMDISTPTVTISSPTVQTTCANPTVTIDATSTPSTGVTYSWTAPGSGSLNTYTVSNPVASGSGIFTVVVTTTVNGCSSSLTQNTVEVIADAALPTTTLTSNTETITCSNPTPTVNIAVSTNSVSYSWTPTTGIVAGTETTATPSFSLAGTYSVIVTNTVSGCATSANSNSVTVTLDNSAPSVSLTTATNNGTITCTNTFVIVTPTVTPGSNLTYTWSPGAGISTSVNQANATFTAAGIYTLAVTNTVTGCITSSTNTANTFTVIADNIPPTFTLGTAPSVTATCAVPNVTLSGTSNADPNSVYTWTAPSTSTLTGNPIVVSAPGTYTVAVTNTVNGCSSSSISQATVEVVADSGIPTVTLSTTTETITCSNLTPTVNIAVSTNSVSYSWTPTSGIVAGTETTATPSFSAIGSYSVIVTNTVSGCATSSVSNVVTITQNTIAPTMTLTTAAANDGTLTCLTTSVNVTPAITGSDLTYTWSPSVGISTPLNQANASFTAVGVYTLAITNTLTGCVSVTDATSTFTVYENIVIPTFTLNGAPSVTMTCATPNATLSGTSSADPNSIYTWTTPIPSTVIGNPIVVSSAGIYSVTVTNTVNGCSGSSISQATVEVVADSGVPTVTLSTTTETITCTNLTPTVNIAVSTNSVSYSWTPTTGIVAGTETTATPSFSAAGSYSVIVTNTVSGCATSSVSNVVTITKNTIAPTMTLSSTTNDDTLTCLRTSINVAPVIVGTDLTYTWSPSAGISTPINQANASFTAVGVYTLAITNTLTGCVSITDATSTFTVYQDTLRPTATIAAISTNSTIGCGGSSSTVTLSAAPTPTNYTFAWLPGLETTPTIDVTSPGIYILNVVDAVNSCTATTEYTVTGNNIPPQNVDAGTLVSIPCGSLTVVLTGTTTSTNVNYSWSGPSATSIVSGGSTANPSVNEVGDYTVTVTDNLTSCTSTATVNVSQANVTATITADPTQGLSPLPVSFTCTSTGAINFSWNFGDGNTSASQNPVNIFTTNGTYTVVLTASSGPCTSTASIVIVVEDGLTLEIPNVFTPNNDGLNDLFTIKSTGIKEISLQIFNRWGQKLYEFSGPKASWDGLVPNGTVAPEGTYFYFVKATGFDDKVIEKNGTMNLFR